MLYTLNVRKISAKEHQLADSCTADEISVSEKLFWRYLENISRILGNYKNLKKTKIAKFKISSVLIAQLISVTAVE